MYIDPGSGSMLIQVLVASALGFFIAFRKSIASLISRCRSDPRPPTGGNP